MSGSVLQSLAYLLWLAGSYFIILIAVKSVRMHLRSYASREHKSWRKGLYRILTNEGIIIQASKAKMLVFGMAVGFATGYTAKELQHYRNIDVMYALHVLGNDNVDSYMVEDRQHNISTLKFCKDFIPEFQDDSIIEWIRFEQTPTCVNVKDHDLGFKILRARGAPVKYSKLR